LRGCLKCKGQNDENKGYFKLTGDAKREPFKFKKKETPKTPKKQKPKQPQKTKNKKKRWRRLFCFFFSCTNVHVSYKSLAWGKML
jgi:hypothetical protein